MKFFGGHLIVTSLALAVISTPLQHQESGIVGRASPDVDVESIEERVFDEDLTLPRDVASTNGGIHGVEKQFAPVFDASDVAVQAFDSIAPDSTLRKIYAAQKKLVWFISLLAQACTNLKRLPPCVSRKDAQAVTALIRSLADIVSQLLEAICGKISTYEQLDCLYIWIPLVSWLQHVVISTMKVAIIIVEIDGGSRKTLTKLMASLNTDFANALNALSP